MAYGSIINVPPTPEKDGYTFSGWSDVPATMPAKDLVISANYNVNSYKLTFIIDDVVIEEKEIAYGSEIVAPATPDKEGHKFIGWFNFVSTMPAADLIISGTYEKNSHLLSFVIDGQVIEERVLPYGSEITVPEAPIKEGYSFLGWEQIPTSMPAKDLVINGSYSLNSYKITFYVDDKMLEEKWVAFGSEITAPEAAPKEGYSFSGWGGIPSTMPATDLEFKGSYTINIYKLTFIIDDVVVEEKQLTFGSEIVAPATPDKEGHKFIGWFNFVSTMPAADLIISGTYEKNSHLLSFVIDGQVVEERVLPYGSEITVPEAPVKLGHTFAGWDNLPSVMPAKDLVVTGSYLVNTYTVTFTIDDVLVKTEELPYGAEIVVPEAPEKEGYTFVGWGDVPTTMPAWNLDFKAAYMTTLYKLTFIIDDVVVEEKQLTFGSEIVAPATPDKDGQQFVGWFNFVSTMPAADLTIYGTYEKNNHLLTFMIDGQVIAEKVLASGSEITVPEAPEKEGYTFAGWDNVPSVMPAKDLVINGSYIANLYKLTFSVNGEIIESIELPYGSPITVPAAPEIEGCTFLGWGNVPATMPAFDLTFTGMYSAKTYRLLVYVNEEVYMDEMIPYGTVVMVKDPVAPENMKFEGWSETIPTTMPAHDVTIYGKMVEDGQSSVIGTLVNANDNVTIYNLNGVMLYKDVKANEIKERLTPGIYIINGKKVIIR